MYIKSQYLLFYFKLLNIINMKFMSNFDTSLRDNLLKEYQTKFWKEKVLLIRRTYIFFFLVVLSPLGGMFWLILILLSATFWINTWYSVFDDLLGLLILIAVVMITITTWSRIIKRFWDYTMDFAIITPHEIIHYNQQWMLNRGIKTMDMEKVKTINVKWWWFIESFFNYGTLIFLSEWDSEYGDLSLNFVAHAMDVKKKIIEIKNHGEELDKE